MMNGTGVADQMAQQPLSGSLPVDAGDAAEALAALQGSRAGVSVHGAPGQQAPGAPPAAARGTHSPAVRIPGMGRGSSLYRGVSKAGDKKKWRAMIQYNHEQHHVGYYPTAEEAARAYDRKALLFMGPSAITNFPAADYEGEALDGAAEGAAEQGRKRRRTSSFKGVTKAGRRWRASLRVNNVKKELGTFDEEIEAARAYDAEAIQIWGATAQTNFGNPNVLAGVPQEQQQQQQGNPTIAGQQYLSQEEHQQHQGAMPDQAGAGMVGLQGGGSGSLGGADLHGTLNAAGMDPNATQQGGLQNQTRFHGVRYAGNNKWHSQVVVDLGKYDSEEAAARAHDRAAVWCLGLTATTNFPAAEWALQAGPSDFVAQSYEDTGGNAMADGALGAGPDTAENGGSGLEAAAADNAAAAAGVGCLTPAQEALGFTGAQLFDVLGGGRGPEQAAELDAAARAGQGLGSDGQALGGSGGMQEAASAAGGASSSGRPPKASRYTGLSKKFNRWKALIKVFGKRKELGSFATEEDAARCYDKHAVLAWGARARTNFNILELVATLPDNARTILDAAAEGRRERASGRQIASGAISAAVQSALERLPTTVDSSTREGQQAHAAIASAMAGGNTKKSKYRGVNANWSRWRAQVYVGGERRELGSFQTEEEAARAYDQAAISMYGADKARTNFPLSDYLPSVSATAGAAHIASATGGGGNPPALPIAHQQQPPLGLQTAPSLGGPQQHLQQQQLMAELQQAVSGMAQQQQQVQAQPGGAGGGFRTLESMLAEGNAAQLQPFLGQMLAASQLAGMGSGDHGAGMQEAFPVAGMHHPQPGAHGGAPGPQLT